MSIVSTLVSIFRSRTRSLLTMAGIAVGVFSVVLVSTVGTVGASQVSATLVTMGVDTLLVQAARFIKRFYVRRFANNVKRRM